MGAIGDFGISWLGIDDVILQTFILTDMLVLIRCYQAIQIFWCGLRALLLVRRSELVYSCGIFTSSLCAIRIEKIL